VVAKDSSDKVIGKSYSAHVYTNNYKGGYTNAKNLKLSEKSITLNKGEAAKIKATQTKVKKWKKLCKHTALLRYTTDNTNVATVSKNGVITAKGTGTCKIYVQTVNGIWKTVAVNVK
jgi:translation initiation factor RLI1